MEKTFSRNDIIWYAFYSKLATFTDFEKTQLFFFKKFFLKKKQISYLFDKSYYFNRIYGKFPIV